MTLNALQKTAEKNLYDAINSYLNAFNRNTEGALITNYIIVVEGISYRENAETPTEIHFMVTNDGQTLSIAKGLLVIGQENVESD